LGPEACYVLACYVLEKIDMQGMLVMYVLQNQRGANKSCYIQDVVLVASALHMVDVTLRTGTS
jgi:hypothetical protein